MVAGEFIVKENRMKVGEVMQTKVLTVTPQTSYEETAFLLHKHRINGVPVVEKDGRLVGMISEKDLFKALYPHYENFARFPDFYANSENQEAEIKALRLTPISEYMVTHVFTVTPDTPILKAGGLMLAHKLHRLPVIDRGKLVGIITRDNVYCAVLVHHLTEPNSEPEVQPQKLRAAG
jgi:CBS domain-containing protein